MTRCLVALLLLLGCAAPEPAYEHSRYDYWAFRARVGVLPEPNYLPWVTHLETLPGGDSALVACRWSDDAFPIPYWIEEPTIPSELQDEFNPRDPGEYVAAVHAAFRQWEEAIDRPLRFHAVDTREEAVLRVHLRADEYQAEDVRVLGLVRGSSDHCRVMGGGDVPEAVPIEFAVPEAILYVTDQHGLLTPRQVRTVALHEIGHVLGASGQHSPLRGDVMYQIADDSRVDAISEHDLNTFRALYRLPPGAVYARLGEEHAEPLAEVRRAPPKLGDPQTDERYGFTVRFPAGWQVIRSRRGWVAVDGVSWDYDASVQVMVVRAPFDEFVDQQRRLLQMRDELETAEIIEIDEQPVARLTSRGEGFAEQMAVQAWDDDWLIVMVADCSDRDYPLYRPWFERVLLSIEREPATPEQLETPADSSGAGAGAH